MNISTSPTQARLVRALSFLAALFCTVSADAGLLDIVTKGSTDRSVTVDIIDSADGTPETGVVYNTSGIDLWYRREGAALVSITEATLASLTTAHSDGGFLHVANGTYRLDLPDAAFATGANYVDIGGTVTGMVVIGGRVRLVDYSLEDSVRGTAGTALPNAAAGASGGVLISGSNSGTTTLGALTVSGATTLTGNVSMAAGLNITQSSSNTAALVITGNGTGNGATITSGSGATGTGLAVSSAATNGSAMTLAGVGTGNGLTATGGATGHGISGVGGSTSGNGIRAAGTAGNSAALNLIGQGSAAGLLSTGGATGHGASLVGGSTSGSGLSAVASTSGTGITATGVGTTQAGIAATGGATSSPGISATGGGTGSGLLATSGSGATGNGAQFTAASTNGNAIGVTATGSGLIFSTPANANVTQYGGSAGTFSGGRPETNTTHWGGTAVASATVNANMTQVSGDSTAADNLETSFDDTQTEVPWMGWTRQGTAQAASGTTATLDASAPFGDNTNVGGTLWLKGSTNGNYWQPCLVSAYVSSTKVATISCASGFVTPTGTISYKLAGTAPSTASGSTNVTQIEGSDATDVIDARIAAAGLATASALSTVSSKVDTVDDYVDTEVAAIKTKTDYLPSATAGASGGVFIAGTNAATTVTTSFTTTFTGNLTGSVGSVTGAVGSVTGAVGSVTGNVGGNVAGSVGSLATQAKADVNAEADTALSDIYLNRLFASDYDPASKPGTATALLNELVENDGGVSRFTANALEQGPAGGGGSTNVTQIEGSDATDVIDARIAAASLATASALTTVGNNVSTALTRIGTPSDLGSGASLAANNVDIEGQTDDIGVAGAGLTAADDSVMTRLGTPAGASVSADVSTVNSAVAAVNAAVAALNNMSPTQLRDLVIEDQGGGVTLGCAMAVVLAYASGDLTTSGSNSTYKDPSGTENRATGTVSSAGNRAAAITCPTY